MIEKGNTAKLMSNKLRKEVWLIVAFGSGKKWHKALKRIEKSTSKNLDEIDLTYVPYNEVNLEKLNEYPEIKDFIVNNTIGYGYWIWKPLIVLDALSRYPNANGVIYIDAGCELNLNKTSIKRLLNYTKLARQKKILTFELQYLEYEYTSHDVINKIIPNLSPLSKQICATTFLASNSAYTKKLLRQWYIYMKSNHFLYLKSEVQKKSGKSKINLIAHRNDQSIFSLLIRKNRIKPIPDETFWGPKWKKGSDYPIWATRNRQKYSVRHLPTFQNLIRASRKKLKNLDFNKLS